MTNNLPSKRFRIARAVRALADPQKVRALYERYISPDGPNYERGTNELRDFDKAFRNWRIGRPDEFPERHVVMQDFLRKWCDGDIVAFTVPFALGSDGKVEIVDRTQLMFLEAIDWERSKITLAGREWYVEFCRRDEFDRWKTNAPQATSESTITKRVQIALCACGWKFLPGEKSRFDHDQAAKLGKRLGTVERLRCRLEAEHRSELAARQRTEAQSER